jgi:hypothetical protein
MTRKGRQNRRDVDESNHERGGPLHLVVAQEIVEGVATASV